MTKRNATVRYSLSEIKKKLARGEGKTRADAPEGQPVGKEFWKRARVVKPKEENSQPMHSELTEAQPTELDARIAR